MEPFTITRDDHPARGGRGLRATVRLRPGTMLVQPYAGRVELCAEGGDSPQLGAERSHYAAVVHEYENRCVSGAVADGPFSGEVEAPPMYDFDLQLVRIEPRQAPAAPSLRGGGGGAGAGAGGSSTSGNGGGGSGLSYPFPVTLLVRGYTVGGMTGCINDVRGVPGAAVNAKVVEVLLGGVLPLLFVVTTRDVPAGDELFISYGDRYWAHYAGTVSSRNVTAMNLRRCTANNMLAVTDAVRQLRADAAELQAAAQLLELRKQIACNQAAEDNRAESRAALAARLLPRLQRAVKVQGAELSRLEAAVEEAHSEQRAADARAAALRDAADRDGRKARSFHVLRRLLEDAVGLMEAARSDVECRFCGKRFSNAHRVKNHGTDCAGYRDAVQAHGVLRCATHLYHELDFPPGYCDDEEYCRHVRILKSALVDAQKRAEADAGNTAAATASPAPAPTAVEPLDDDAGGSGALPAAPSTTSTAAVDYQWPPRGDSRGDHRSGGASSCGGRGARWGSSSAPRHRRDDRRDGPRGASSGFLEASGYASAAAGGSGYGGSSSVSLGARAPPEDYGPYGAVPPPPLPAQQQIQWYPPPPLPHAHAFLPIPQQLQPQQLACYHPQQQQHQYPQAHVAPVQLAAAPLYGGGGGGASHGGAYIDEGGDEDNEDDHFNHLQQLFGGGAPTAAPAPPPQQAQPQSQPHAWTAIAAPLPPAPPPFLNVAASNAMTNPSSADSASTPSGARFFSWEERR